ncbi:hypothetical protein BHE74_00019254 [Ensete ventricosum]|nr:hypothetical protein BHE74_00019254 [Ensete ventricosum]
MRLGRGFAARVSLAIVHECGIYTSGLRAMWLARTLGTDVVWTTRRRSVLPKGWDMWLTCPEVVGPSWFEETGWIHRADLGPPWNRGPRYVISFSPVPKGVSPRGESRGATRGNYDIITIRLPHVELI